MDENHKKPREILEEKFGALESKAEAPEELREEVFNTLDAMGLFADLADLFTVKFTETSAVVLKNLGDLTEENIGDTGNDKD